MKTTRIWSRILGVSLFIMAVSWIVSAPLTAFALSRPPFPVIFIHGLAGSANSWVDFDGFLRQNGWVSG